MRKVIAQILNSSGPIFLSAFSIFVTFTILQPLALLLHPSFNLLASRGTGKVAFVVIVIFQILLLLLTLPKTFLDKCLKINIYFFAEKKWLLKFSSYFIAFFTLHSLIISLFYFLGYLTYSPEWGPFNLDLILKLFWILVLEIRTDPCGQLRVASFVL